MVNSVTDLKLTGKHWTDSYFATNVIRHLNGSSSPVIHDYIFHQVPNGDRVKLWTRNFDSLLIRFLWNLSDRAVSSHTPLFSEFFLSNEVHCRRMPYPVVV